MTQFQLMQTAADARDARDVAERANVRMAARSLAQARQDLARAKRERARRQDDAAVRLMARIARVVR